MKNLIIAGSTGSIGQNTIEIVRRNPERLKIKALCAGSNWEMLAQQAREFEPEIIGIADERLFDDLKKALNDSNIKIVAGPDAGVEVASHEKADTLVAAIVGAAGLKPVMSAIKHNKNILLANKETLVVGGDLVTRAVREKDLKLIPIDSEHSAIFQCLQNSQAYLQKIIITASGGPFRDFTEQQMKDIKLEQALKHPNWNMGGKITIDSATLMNKGLEVIEAHWLFNQPYEYIDVVIHPQSIIHSLVEFTDGSVVAQLGWPDMKLPIQYALSFPERWGPVLEPLDLVKVGAMTFEKPDLRRFPLLEYASVAGKQGETMPCILNAANEIAVNAFMKKAVSFNAIAEIVYKTLERFAPEEVESIDQLLELDKEARNVAREIRKSL
ncbi:MAG: 1-deoxy-D-xylulose-5-phosphate reductoisomerase [Candidatus Rifleibacteriota bacterium]